MIQNRIDQPIIHIVEDDVDVLRSMKILLAVKGYRVQTYATGEAFLDALDAIEPGCLLLDLNLPGIDGVDVLEKLSGHIPALPVLAMTGGASAATRNRALKLGAITVFDKPVSIPDLVSALATVFG